ncbi:MAG: CHAT domain-containing protein, partial [Caldilineaceae bacterium]|nr:CHAT domain-containing protein [Caldilineaceae bacterium]
MPLISIRERGINHDGPVVAIDGQEYPLPQPLTPPFDERAERELEWYFEEHLRFPFTHQVRAAEAGASIERYGKALFKQVFRDPDAYAEYRGLMRDGLETLTFDIIGGPDFQRLHWEALWDEKLPQPLALQCTFVRRNIQPQIVRARVRTSPTINLLVVTARPGGRNDVGYRTISRPLIGALRQANVPVQVDILRPATYAALVQHLEEKQDSAGAGYYHVIHFDVHGALLPFDRFDAMEEALETSHLTYPTMQPQRFGRARLAPYPGVKAFLFLESGAPGLADPVEATELADLLLTHQIPIAILNACQSGKYVQASVDSEQWDSGESDSDLDESRSTQHASRSTQETSLGSQLMAAGMQMVLAMGYSVTVSAAEIMMARLYGQLFVSGDVAAAIRAARLELHNRKARRVYFNQQIELEDWLLPVVYENQRQRLQTRDFTEEEANAYYEAQANAYQ